MSGIAHLRLRHIAARRYALGQPHIAANGRPGAHRDAAQDGGAGVDDDVVLDDRMARRAFHQRPARVHREALGAQRYRLVQAHALPEDGGLADHDPGAVVDEEAGADLRARVDVDASQRMADVGHDARQKRRAQALQAMRDAVVQNRDGARVAQHDLGHRGCRRITRQRRLHVGHQQRADRRQAGREFACDGARPVEQHGIVGEFVLAGKAQRAPHLLGQPVEHHVKGVGDEVIDAFVVQVGAPVVSRKQGGGHAVDDLAHDLARRQFAHAAMVADVMGGLARSAQRVDDGPEVPLHRAAWMEEFAGHGPSLADSRIGAYDFIFMSVCEFYVLANVQKQRLTLPRGTF